MKKPRKNRWFYTGIILAFLVLLAGAGIYAGAYLRKANAAMAEKNAEEAGKAVSGTASGTDGAAEESRTEAEKAADKKAAEKLAAEKKAAEERARLEREAAENKAKRELAEQQTEANRELSSLIAGAGAATYPNTVGYLKLKEKDELEKARQAAATFSEGTTGRVVCIDPGHQAQDNRITEPIGPGEENVEQQAATRGTPGDTSGKEEYEIDLEVGLKLKKILIDRGYTVIMTRESNEVDLTNMQRAEIASSSGAQICVQLHCETADSPIVAGAFCYQPSEDNPYMPEDLIRSSRRMADVLRDHQCAVTGQMPRASLDLDNDAGINWCRITVCRVIMGFLSNPDEDMFLASDDGQNLVALGLANGIDSYYQQ